jgi:hypothetical protein
LSLRTKWTASLLFASVAPLTLFAVRSSAIQKQGLVDAERQLEVAVLDHASALLSATADDAADATHRVGRILSESTIASDDTRLSLARETVARADSLCSVSIYDPKGALIDGIARSGARATPSPMAAIAPADLADPRPRWRLEHTSDGGIAVRYVEPVDRDGERRAWVVGTLDAAAIDARLEAISRDRFDARRDGVLLVDDQARVVAGGGGTFAAGESLAGRDIFSNA